VRSESHPDSHSAPAHDQAGKPQGRSKFPDEDVGGELEDDVWDEEDHGQDGVAIAHGEFEVQIHAGDACVG
jgi:hypothetical protein